MKKLFIIRHAKSSWDSGVEDYNRSLKTIGKLAAPFMAEKLMSRGVEPDMLISSSAKRTLQTTELISSKMGIAKDKIRYTKDLYLASPKTIISIIQSVPDEVNELMIVAHNPGVTQVINYLATEHFENVPTSGVACILCPIDSWSELKNNGKLGFYLYPKMFKINFGNKD